MVQRILVVEDEPAIAESVAYALGRDGFSVTQAATATDAATLVDGADLVVLDLMLPDGSGFDLIGRWRKNKHIPVIVLSSRDGEADRVVALEAGADDYVTKPFSPREVVARVRAVLRRSQNEASPGAPTPVISLDSATRRARANGSILELTRVEFDVLSCLLEQPGRVYSRVELIDRVWGDGFAITDRTIDSHVKALRKKVAEAGAEPGLIETVRGVASAAHAHARHVDPDADLPGPGRDRRRVCLRPGLDGDRSHRGPRGTPLLASSRRRSRRFGGHDGGRARSHRRRHRRFGGALGARARPRRGFALDAARRQRSAPVPRTSARGRARRGVRRCADPRARRERRRGARGQADHRDAQPSGGFCADRAGDQPRLGHRSGAGSGLDWPGDRRADRGLERVR